MPPRVASRMIPVSPSRPGRSRSSAATVAALPVAAEIADLHVWRVGKSQYACILSLVVTEAVEPDAVRQALSVHEELVHVTVEVNRRHTAPAIVA
jgi:Co/Zn/Cd efflux system component